jgi:hypothetical protein
MAVKTVARRMASSGHGHEHIAYLWWENSDGSSGFSSREEMMRYIEQNGDNSVWCPDRDPQRKGQWVHVSSNGRTKYVQTFADGRWSDNLLALPLR